MFRLPKALNRNGARGFHSSSFVRNNIASKETEIKRPIPTKIPGNSAKREESKAVDLETKKKNHVHHDKKLEKLKHEDTDIQRASVDYVGS
jgi:hypothetical protein